MTHYSYVSNINWNVIQIVSQSISFVFWDMFFFVSSKHMNAKLGKALIHQ